MVHRTISTGSTWLGLGSNSNIHDSDGERHRVMLFAPYGDVEEHTLNVDRMTTNPDMDYGRMHFVSHLKVEGELGMVLPFEASDPLWEVATSYTDYVKVSGVWRPYVQKTADESGVTTITYCTMAQADREVGDIVETSIEVPQHEINGIVTCDRHIRRLINGKWYDIASTTQYRLYSTTPQGCVSRNIDLSQLSFLLAGARDNIEWDTGDIGNNESQLFVECCKGFNPLSETNNIANVKAIIDALKGMKNPVNLLMSAKSNLKKFFKVDAKDFLSDAMSFVKDNVSVEKAQNAWLTYRYVYTTTKADIELHQKSMRTALSTMGDWFSTKTLHASGSSGDFVTHMQVDMTSVADNLIQEIWQRSNGFGLQLNATNIWDMIPFSFVVDWFLPIGDLCDRLDTAMNYSSAQYSFSNICFSMKASKVVETSYGSFTVTKYVRRPMSKSPSLSYSSDYEPSLKTWIKRGIDSFSLFVSI